MINNIYELLKTILNKELRGVLSPTEFNLLAKQVQEEIFRGYFEDEARDKVKEKKGMSVKGYGNLAFNQRQRLDQFSAKANLVYSSPSFALPSNLYMIKDDGVLYDGTVVTEMEGQYIGYASKSLGAPSETFPVYEHIGSTIEVLPSTITSGVVCRYIRKPLDPKWTYTIVSNMELFNPSAVDFQDFELHASEFSNIVIRMASYFGINLREEEVIKYIEIKKQDTVAREEQ